MLEDLKGRLTDQRWECSCGCLYSRELEHPVAAQPKKSEAAENRKQELSASPASKTWVLALVCTEG